MKTNYCGTIYRTKNYFGSKNLHTIMFNYNSKFKLLKKLVKKKH